MRSVSQIYSEAITTRNNYLQLTELNTGRTNSKMSIMNLMTYVVAVCIFTYEAILEAFEVRITSILAQRINGTPQWYAVMAKMFQYNSALDTGDEIVFDENTLKVNYKQIDKTHRIVVKSAWQSNGDGQSITLKVAKNNSNSNEVNNGTPYTQLTSAELSAFRDFIQHIKFVGSEVLSESCPGDIITIIADAGNPVYYNDTYITASQALDAIKNNIIQFAKDFEFNGVIYYQSLIDVIRKTDNIVGIGNNIKVFVKQWNIYTNSYDTPVELNSRMRLKSGYIKLIDNNAVTINATNITLVPSSTIELYDMNL